MPSSHITATTLSVHAHLQCDLYLHQSYHRGPTSTEAALTHRSEIPESPTAISQAAFASGNTWESTLLTHLERLNLLLPIFDDALSGLKIASIIEIDERPHFFVSGIKFWPPSERLAEEYAKHGVKAEHVPRFGLAQPDLLEVRHENNGRYIWRIIDAKASKDVKPSHLVQTYFYYLCLSFILPPSFVPGLTIATWLPPDSLSSVDSSVPFPLLATLHSTPIAPLIPPLTDLIFIRLPAILSTPQSEVPWHFNPLCRSCPFSSSCRVRVEKENGLGKVGELNLSEADEIREFMKLARGIPSPPKFHHDADIEDLVHTMDDHSVVGENSVSELSQLRGMLQDKRSMNYMADKWPTTVNKVHRILAIRLRDKLPASSPSKLGERLKLFSPVIEAALMNVPQFINRRIYTFPYSEDIAIYFSFIVDPSRSASVSTISEFCVSTNISPAFAVIARKYGYKSRSHIHGSIDSLIPSLSKCIRNVLDLHARILGGNQTQLAEDYPNRATKSRATDDLPRTQFYVWSVQEREALQRYLVNTALSPSSSPIPGVSDPEIMHGEDIRLCIGALCEGASLLATTFQPHILDGAFVEKIGRSKKELESMMARLGLKSTGNQTIETMRKKITEEICRLHHHGKYVRAEPRTVGVLPRIVVLKKELRRLVAFPVPGWWDAREAGDLLGAHSANQCPTEEELFRRFWEGEEANLASGMEARNNTCQEVVSEIRYRMDRLSERSNLLVNRARVLSAEWVDLCHIGVLRKLFYMQQFEVLLKLQELWDMRMEGCPDAPLLVYRSKAADSSDGNGSDQVHNFDLLSGTIEVTSERDRAFYNYLLVKEEDDDDQFNESTGHSHLPLEALFDDLCVSDLYFPPNYYTRSKWEAGQATEVKEGNLWVALIEDVNITNGTSRVMLRIWSGGGKKTLLPGKIYRLSPRLVDFNTTKILNTLVELDLQATSASTPSSDTHLPLFVDLISKPKSFSGQGSAVRFPRESHIKDIKVALDVEAALHRRYTERSDRNENAWALVLKASQREAARRILSDRLTVIWGPPGSGKSYTIALSLLRMIEVQSLNGTLLPERQLIFITAMTHAAIDACLSKLREIIEYYKSMPCLSLGWLDELQVEHVSQGYRHLLPTNSRTYIYAGTVYQLYNFGKRLGSGVDCVAIDEAGQLGLCAASLVLRALSRSSGIWGGKVVVAGDREQLAPIFSGKYPELGKGQPPLFGSVLDTLIGSDEEEDSIYSSGATTLQDKNPGSVIQLLENFRLNPDLGNFIQTIYKRTFIPQKSQTKLLAARLGQLENEASGDVVREKARNILLSLSSAMLGKKQLLFEPPIKQESTEQQSLKIVSPGHHVMHASTTLDPHPISLAMVRLHVQGDTWGEMAYESHVRTEAKVAAILVQLLKRACDEGDGIFVACPHRIQRAAVNMALSQRDGQKEEQIGQDEEEELQQLILKMGIETKEGDENQLKKRVDGRVQTIVPVTVDTIERLQGSEASFVICLFSHTHRASLATALPFLLVRRRLNVAISRAKTLCIVISSQGVLRPGVILSDRESVRGYAFLREFEDRAWTADIEVEMDI